MPPGTGAVVVNTDEQIQQQMKKYEEMVAKYEREKKKTEEDVAQLENILREVHPGSLNPFIENSSLQNHRSTILVSQTASDFIRRIGPLVFCKESHIRYRLLKLRILLYPVE